MINQNILQDLNQPFAQSLSNQYHLNLAKKIRIKDESSQFKTSLIKKPLEQRIIDTSLSIYINQHFMGINHDDYKYAHRRTNFLKEKLKTIQEVDHQVYEKKNVFQEKELIMIKIEESCSNQCSKCQTQSSKKFYELDKRVLCDDCATIEQPEQLSRLKLKQLIKRNESKGQKYEEKLKKFYEKSLKELKLLNQMQISAKSFNQQ